ncbi:MAG: oligosaccharide flippase family protein [Actinomycetaceae bacterium]|nr:oligosaccharide flippase family protein [Actinomycetaceae bacterium]
MAPDSPSADGAHAPGWRAWLKRYPLLQQSLTMLAGNSGAQLLVLLLLPILSRLYSPEDFGQFGVYTAICAIVVPLAGMRLDIAAILPHREDEAKILMRIASRSILVWAVLTSLIAFLAGPALTQLTHTEYLVPYLPLMGATVATLAQIQAMSQWKTRQQEFRELAWNKVLQHGSVSASQILLWLTGMIGMFGLLSGSLIGQGIAAIFLTWSGRQAFKLGQEANPEVSWRSLIRRYWKMPALNGATAILDSVRVNGIVLLVATFSTAAVGHFNMAWMLVQAPVALITGSINSVFYRAMATTPRGDLYRLVKSSILKFSIVSVSAMALLLIFAPWFIPLILGENWSNAGLYAQALAPWLMLTVVTSPIASLYVVTNTQQYMLGFGVLFTATPLLILAFSPFGLLLTIWMVSASMSVLLIGLAIMSLLVAKRWDRQGPAPHEVGDRP